MVVDRGTRGGFQFSNAIFCIKPSLFGNVLSD